MTETDKLLDNARAYAAGRPSGQAPVPAGAKVAILACMDARLNPYDLLGLEPGDAHVIRNAGGVVTEDAIRSLAISQRLLGGVSAIDSRRRGSRAGMDRRSVR
jgi:carbonic anhydrase